MKIMMVISGMKSGGAEKVMATLCSNLSTRHEVVLLILKSADSDYIISDNVKIIAGNIKHKNMFKSIRFVKNELNSFKPDVVVSFMTKNNIVSILASKFSEHKCPVIISERANPYYPDFKIKILRRIVYPYADGCVFQTKLAQNYYKNILRCDSVVIKNPLTSDFCLGSYKGVRKKNIICVARLSKEKNQELLIRAFSYIHKKYPDYKLELYGDGPQKDYLQDIISELNLNDSARLMGRKNNIQDYIKDAGIFVLPSNSEGMPNSLLEAMCLGIPSIATDCPIGGSADIIQNGKNGILIPMGNREKLIEAIDKIISDPDFSEKLSINAIKIFDNYDENKICSMWEEYFKLVIKKWGN